jgi:hypothetical protein
MRIFPNLFSRKICCSNAKWLYRRHHIEPVGRSVSGDDCFPKWGGWSSSCSLPESLTERKWGLVDVTAAVDLLPISITPPPQINLSKYIFNHTFWVTIIYSEITYLRAYTLVKVFIPLGAPSLSVCNVLHLPFQTVMEAVVIALITLLMVLSSCVSLLFLYEFDYIILPTSSIYLSYSFISFILFCATVSFPLFPSLVFTFFISFILYLLDL